MMTKKVLLFLTNVIGICPSHGQAACNRSKIQTLERFEVTNKNDVQRLIPVQTKVKWLEVYLSDISWLTALNMPLLKSLSLKACHTLKALHCLKAPLLKSLHIYEMDFRKEQNWGIFSFSNLEHLSFSKCRMGNGWILSRFQSPKLKDLFFTNSVCHAVDFNCVKEKIKTLYMGDCLLDEKILGNELNPLILRTLVLQDDSLKDVNFLKYVNFSKMERLVINSRQVKDISILKNLELPILEAIDLFCPLVPVPHWGGQLKAPELCEFILNNKYIICRPGKGI
ncbi:MAG: hypothetical protein BGO07_01650 [Alphaproteobacteria bacterium 40-19]|nr:MAG: hypothetical protein BGO07_01650 [Alphaproteobacteria bacterium 40-19]